MSTASLILIREERVKLIRHGWVPNTKGIDGVSGNPMGTVNQISKALAAALAGCGRIYLGLGELRQHSISLFLFLKATGARGSTGGFLVRAEWCSTWVACRHLITGCPAIDGSTEKVRITNKFWVVL